MGLHAVAQNLPADYVALRQLQDAEGLGAQALQVDVVHQTLVVADPPVEQTLLAYVVGFCVDLAYVVAPRVELVQQPLRRRTAPTV